VVHLDSTDVGAVIAGLVGLLIILAILAMVGGLYMLPTIIAIVRHHHNTLVIALVDIFFGWSFIGWFIALAMALWQRPETAPVIIQQSIGQSAMPTAATPTPSGDKTQYV
jgi:hypothetical protein